MANGLDARNISNMKQELDMQHAAFTTRFDYADKASVSYTYYSFRHLPFTVLMDITVYGKKRYFDHRRQCNGSTGCIEGCTELL